MNEQELLELDKLVAEALENGAPVYIQMLGRGIRDAVAEVRRLQAVADRYYDRLVAGNV